MDLKDSVTVGIRTSSVRRARPAFCRFRELRPGFRTPADALSSFVLALAQLIPGKRPGVLAHCRMDAPWRRRLPECEEGTAVVHCTGADYRNRQEVLNQPFDIGLTGCRPCEIDSLQRNSNTAPPRSSKQAPWRQFDLILQTATSFAFMEK